MSRAAKPRPARGRRTFLAVAVLAGGALAGAGPASAEGATGPSAPPCSHSRLVANSAERVGADGVRIVVINEGPGPCVLEGHPTLALAGQGSPDRNRPLSVVRQGAARPVRLGVGGAAETRVSFTPVLGEAGGYCASGAEPFVAPSTVVGIAGGHLQLGPDDGGAFALCGTTVRATAFRAAS
ncbi:DUF4232 domain-containing protein [Streptomyces sp. NPDC059989]|uniref:DUF4232 domain-containing protein n=1 Tax=Streptomyces sp. NPDC059989 TaxID=3347026 RepID=UPI0036C5570D